MSMPATETIAMRKTTTGYVRADLIVPRQLDFAFVVDGDRIERTLKESTRFARSNEVDHERRKDRWMLGESCRKSSTIFDIGANLTEGAREDRVLGLLRQDGESAKQREPSGNHGCKLPAHDRRDL